MDPLDEALLNQIIGEQWPNDRLPTIKECLYAMRNPETVDPLLSQYIVRRPNFKKFLRECIDGDRK